MTKPVFHPSHRITLPSSEVEEVMLIDGAGYTQAEWDSETQADYECDETGAWTFQGEPFAGTVEPVTYEVRMADRVENTGLDCQRFASREEAQRAADIVNADHPAARAEVIAVTGEPTITFAKWADEEPRDYGTLTDYYTGEPIRPATADEQAASREAAPEGVILVSDDGTILRADDAGADDATRCYVAE